MHHNGYVLPTFSRWDGVGRFHFCEGILYSSKDLDWLDQRFERSGNGWKLPRPPDYIPYGKATIVGKGIAEAGGGLRVGINHWPEGDEVACIMQDFQKPVYRKDALTIISDELIPLFNADLFPDAGPAAMIPLNLQGKDPTALVACKMFGNVTLTGFDGVFAEDAPNHYKIQREGLGPYMRTLS